MTDQDEKISSSSRPSERRAYSGINALRALKAISPTTPFIAFTASSNANSLQAVLDEGGDAYWIKEDPEQGVDLGYSIENATRLVRVLRQSVEAREEKQFLWELLTRVHEATTDKDYRALVDNLNGPPRAAKALKEIRELLQRGYGYLDADFRATQFQRRSFKFAPKAIAYLHLWGCLNQAVELRFASTGRVRRLLTADGKSVAFWHTGTSSGPDSWFEPHFRALPDNAPRIQPSKNFDPEWAYCYFLLDIDGHDAEAQRLGDSGEPRCLRVLRNNLGFVHGDSPVADERDITMEDLRAVASIVGKLLLLPSVRR